MRTCVICAKGATTGNSYKRRGMEKKKGGAGSKIVGKSRRWVKPNLQRIKIRLENVVQRALVCTSCIQAGKIVRAV